MTLRTVIPYIIAAAIILPVASASVTPAAADASNLVCGDSFRKIRTYPNAIKCKRAGGGISTEREVANLVKSARRLARCNAHSSPPVSRSWRKNGAWAYRVTFICAVVN